MTRGNAHVRTFQRSALKLKRRQTAVVSCQNMVSGAHQLRFEEYNHSADYVVT